jgi:predicted ribosome quality control (RQC) complex YloA/Tae2 family protein
MRISELEQTVMELRNEIALQEDEMSGLLQALEECRQNQDMLQRQAQGYDQEHVTMKADIRDGLDISRRFESRHRSM